MCGYLFFACQEKEMYCTEGVTKLNLQSKTGLSDDQLNPVNVFLYKTDRLCQNFENLQPESNGLYPMSLNSEEPEKLIVIAGDNSTDFKDAVHQIQEIKAQSTSPVDFISSFPRVFYTGEKHINGNNTSVLDIELLRSVARLDLRLETTLPIIIDSCIIDHLADKTNYFADAIRPPANLQYRTMRLSSEVFQTASTKIDGVAYFYESHGKAPLLTIYARINNSRTKLQVKLPNQIQRNKRYEVIVNSSGATLYSNLEVHPWEIGGNTEVTPESFTPKINFENSVIPSNIKISDTKDTIYVPSMHTEMILEFDESEISQLMVDNNLVSIEALPVAKGPQTFQGNRYKISFRPNDVNKLDQYIRLYLRSTNNITAYDKYITVVKKANKAHFERLTNCKIDGNVITYSDYIDGSICDIVSSESISNISTESMDDQFNWIKTEQHTNKYVVQGGFKPNDNGAEGQLQRSRLTVNFTDGTFENYEFVRKRTSIPVVRFGGKYWSKFNMCNNSKTYQDQFNHSQDKSDLWSFLQTCSNQEFLSYAGSEYKGRSTQGLTIKKNGTNLTYAGYNSVGNEDIHSAGIYSHCPSGYQIPSKDDFGLIFNTTSAMTLPDIGQTSEYTTSSGKRNRIERLRKSSFMIDGISAPQPYMMKITDTTNNESIIFNGIGHQYDRNSIAWGYWIFATVNAREQYLSINNSRNRIEMLYHNGGKTKIVRCIKSPVSYIIAE